MDLGLSGKKALVTGGTGGIGLAIVETLAAEGAQVMTCSRRQSACDAVNDRLGDQGVYASPCDVGDREAFNAWLQQSHDRMGGVDIVIPNVSGMGLQPGEEAWKASFDVDIMSTVRACEALKPVLAKSGNGSIVIISSISALEAVGGGAERDGIQPRRQTIADREFQM